MNTGLIKPSKRIQSAETKQKMYISSLAIRVAKSLHDPDYEKYKFYKEQLNVYKKKLIKKYAKSVIKMLKEKGVPIRVNVDELTS